MIRLELKNGEVAEIDLHERSITYRSGPHGLAALIKERREADLETTLDVRRLLENQRMEIAGLLQFRQSIIDALGAPDALERIPISDQVRRLKNDAEHSRVMARDATAEREAWIQNAKAATDGKVENPRQLGAYIDGLKHKLSEVAKIVHRAWGATGGQAGTKGSEQDG